MRTIIRKLWMFIMGLCAFSPAFAYDFESDGIYYNIHGYEYLGEYLEVTRAGYNNNYYGDIDIPSSVNYDGKTYRVEAIGDEAFSGCTGLTSVTIPNSVTTIGDEAFYGCDGLTSVTIPASVNTIESRAFTECSSLISIDVDKSSIYYCSIDGILYNKDVTVLIACPGKKETVTIPNSVTTIGYSAFCRCFDLTSVTIPNSVTTIEHYAFHECNGLTSVTIPNSVTTIGNGAFLGCFGLTSVAIPNSVTTISDEAFSGCLDLTSVTIPNSVTSIGNYAFYSCHGLTSVTIPNSVTTIGFSAFSGCDGLTSVTIPNSVTTIGDGAFSGCDGLTSVTIPNSVVTIGNNPFSDCDGLINIIVDENNLNYCSIDGVLYNKDVTSIIACPGKKESVTIPNSVTTIGLSAFSGCTGLTSITSLAVTPPTCDSHVFEYVTKSYCTLYVPANCSDKYKEAEEWKDFASIKEINSVPVNEIRLNKSEITVSVGGSFQLSAEILPSNATDKSIIWESSNTKIATVDQNGKVTAVAQGTAVITAKSTDGSNVSASCNVTVHKLVSGIVLSETELTLNEGQTAQLTATVSPELANNKTLAWSSSDESVATVDQTGKVTAVAQGTAVITAKSTDGSNISASCKVTVHKLVSGIVLSETELTLNEGQSAQLTATVSPELATNKTLAWTSSDETVATVDQTGKVTAVAQGTAVITAKSTDGSNVSASCNVTVHELVSGIVLSETDLTLNEGQTAQLTATVSPELANNKTLAWTSSDEAVATVDQTGKVTAVAQGTAVITAKSTDGSNVSASCNVTVHKLVSGIVLSETDLTLNEGQTAQLTATVSPELANNKTLAWTSSDEAVATVDQTGKVTAVAQGTAVITAKSTDGSDVSASCNVTVHKLVSGIVLSETELTLNEGQTAQLKATVSPELATNKTLAWTSSNEAVATVDQTGKVTAVAQGTAVITAKSTDGSDVSASCNVTVQKLVSGIVLSETDLTLNEGQSAQLKAIVSELANNKTLAWTSSDEAVATVDQTGKVTAVAQGTAVITAKATDGSDVSASCNVTVHKLVSGIVLSETDLTLNEGQTAQLKATVSPELANNKTLAWSSSDEAVATVDQNGKVTAVAQGTAVVTAKSTDGSDVSASCKVTVHKLVSGIVLSETDLTLNEGQSAQLTATVSPELANNKTLAWTSSDEAVATVDQTGKVTAVAQGTAVITAKSTDGSDVSASCNVTVHKLVSGIVLSETELTLNEGQTAQLKATVSPELATNKTLAWTSSNEAVATVDQTGKVTAVAQGTAVITAKSTDGSNVSASCNITVHKLVSGIVLSETELTLNEGQTAQLKATVSPELATNKTLAWTSSNEAVATVDQTGKVTAVAQGTAVITAKSTDGSDVSASCNVTVHKLVSGIVLSETDLTLNEGQTAQLTATVSPELANNKTLAWISSDESVATVDQTGKVTAVAQGTAVITAKSTDGSDIQAECNIKVNKLSSVSDIDMESIRVYSSNTSIYLENVPANTLVRIFQHNGTEIYRTQSIGETISYDPGFRGVYIVIIGMHSYKISNY